MVRKLFVFLFSLGLVGCSTAPLQFTPTESLVNGEKIVVGRFNFNFGYDSRPVLICMEGVTMCKELESFEGDKEYFIRHLKPTEELKITAFNRPPLIGAENFGEIAIFENFVIKPDPFADVTYIGDIGFHMNAIGEPQLRVVTSSRSIDFLKAKYADAGKPFRLKVSERLVTPNQLQGVKTTTPSFCAGKLLCRPQERTLK